MASNLVSWMDELAHLSADELDALVKRLDVERRERAEHERGLEEQRRWDEGEYAYPW